MSEYEDNLKSIKYHFKQYLLRHQERLRNKIVLDLPAWNEVSSNILKTFGAILLAFDLFPEYFKYEDIKYERADVLDRIPPEDKNADHVIC